MVDWILVAALLLGGLALAIAVLQRFETRRRQAEWESRWLKRSQALQSEVGRLRGEITELRSRVEDEEKDPQRASVPSSINLNHRTQALRLLRRGEALENIAATLGIAKCEVELIRKVQKITSETLLCQSTQGRMERSAEDSGHVPLN